MVYIYPTNYIQFALSFRIREYKDEVEEEEGEEGGRGGKKIVSS